MILLQRLHAKNFKQLENLNLPFPQSGTLLIQGNNESGKSTLFEAIFFALFGVLPGKLGKDATPLEEAICYGQTELEVTLDFSVDNRPFTVYRRLRKRVGGGPLAKEARLKFPGADGQTETIKTLSAVDSHIRAELGLSEQGLLNTCFVEQKKLEHLESLDASKRQDAINELLNLSEFTGIEKNLAKPTDLKSAVKAARQHLDVAKLDTEASQLSGLLDWLRPLQTVARLAELHAAQTEAKAEVATAEQEAAQIERMIRLKEQRARLDDQLRPKLAVWTAAAQTEANADRAVRESEAARSALPGLQADVTRLAGLQEALRLCLNFEAEQKRHADWDAEQQAAQAEVERLTTLAETAETALTNAKNALTSAEKHHSLTEWAQAVEALDAAQNPPRDPELERLAQAVPAAETARNEAKVAADAADKAARDAEAASQAVAERTGKAIAAREAARENLIAAAPSAAKAPPATGPNTGGVLVAAGALVAVVATVIGQWWLLGIAAALVVAGGAALSGRAKARRQAAQEQQSQQAEQQRQATERQAERKRIGTQIVDLRAQAEAARRVAQEARQAATNRNRDYTDVLAALGDAQRRHSDYAARTSRRGEIPGLQAAVARARTQMETVGVSPLPDAPQQARERAGAAPAQSLAALRGGVAQTQNAFNEAAPPLRDAERRIVAYLSLHTFSNDELAIIQTAPAALKDAGLPLDPARVTQRVDDAKRSRDTARQLSDDLAARKAILAAAARKTSVGKVDFFQCVTGGKDTDLFPKLDTDDADATPEHAADALDGLGEYITAREQDERADMMALSLPALRERKSKREGDLHLLTARISALQAEEAAPRTRLNLPSFDEQALAQLLPPLQEAYPDALTRTAEQWQARITESENELQRNRADRAAQASVAGITEPMLDESLAQEAWDAATLALDVNTEARKILIHARTRILDRVMPGTQNQVKQILPLLTDRRYREVVWDPGQDSLRVMDARKGDWAAKKVFSGGTRDQISLALRLGFTLAMLPGGKATRPGWLFLDEPLSAFDAGRSENLIKLLTQGQLIRPKFPQIFLITHGGADVSRFDWHLLMEDGKISSASRLPV